MFDSLYSLVIIGVLIITTGLFFVAMFGAWIEMKRKGEKDGNNMGDH